MKKIFCFILVFIAITVLGIDAFAESYIVSEGESESKYDYTQFLPEQIKEILKENGEINVEDIKLSEVIKLIFNYAFAGLNKYSSVTTALLFVILVIAILNNINDNKGSLLILNLLSALIVSKLLIDVFLSLQGEISASLQSLKELLASLMPAFATVTLMGGGTLSAGISSVSFATIITFLETVLATVCTELISVTFIFMIIERISPVFENVSCVKHLKKWVTTIITFISTVMLTVISFQTVLSARADSLSMRSVKFAAANFIPIIGGAVGESLRTVSSGISYLKVSIGGASAFAVFFTVFPIIAEICILKILTTFLALSSSVCQANECKRLLEAFINIIDLMLVVIICGFVLSFLIIFLFTFISFGA